MTKSVISMTGSTVEHPGRVIAAIATDPEIMKRSGRKSVTAALAPGYGITGGGYIDSLGRRVGAWKIAPRANVIKRPGMVPTMPSPFSDVADIHDNSAPGRSKDDPS